MRQGEGWSVVDEDGVVVLSGLSDAMANDCTAEYPWSTIRPDA